MYNFYKSKKIIYIPDEDIKLKNPFQDISLTIYKSYSTEKKNRLSKFIIIRSSSLENIKIFIDHCYKHYVEKEFEKRKRNQIKYIPS